MSNAEGMVDDAAGWADALVTRAHRGPGDTVEAALHRAARRIGVSVHTLWALRYRKPKDLMVSVYMRLKSAYETECERQEARLRHELELTREVLGDAASSDRVVVATEEFLQAVAERAAVK